MCVNAHNVIHKHSNLTMDPGHTDSSADSFLNTQTRLTSTGTRHTPCTHTYTHTHTNTHTHARTYVNNTSTARRRCSRQLHCANAHSSLLYAPTIHYLHTHTHTHTRMLTHVLSKTHFPLSPSHLQPPGSSKSLMNKKPLLHYDIMPPQLSYHPHTRNHQALKHSCAF
jgi:hypothetical protein